MVKNKSFRLFNFSCSSFAVTDFWILWDCVWVVTLGSKVCFGVLLIQIDNLCWKLRLTQLKSKLELNTEHCIRCLFFVFVIRHRSPISKFIIWSVCLSIILLACRSGGIFENFKILARFWFCSSSTCYSMKKNSDNISLFSLNILWWKVSLMRWKCISAVSISH